MSTPEIIALDAALEISGEDITLRREFGIGDSQTVADVTVRAQILSGSRTKGPEDKVLVGNTAQQTAMVIISPTPILAAGWPGVDMTGQFVDPQIPRRGDLVNIAGTWKHVEAAEGIKTNNVVCRIEMRTLG